MILREHPEHPLFRDALFSSPDWAPFAASVVAAETAGGAGHEPWALLIQKAMPAIEESLRNVIGRQEVAFGKILSETSSIKGMLERVIQTQEEQAVQEFTVTTTVSPRTGAAVIVTSSTPPVRQSPSACNLPPQEPVPLGGVALSPPTPLQSLTRRATVPAYKLNRDIQTIPALWKLWTVGVGGAPSVEALDQQYGSGWRQTPAERQYYSMRKTLIDEIKSRVSKAGDGDFSRVVRDMEEKRLSAKPPMSIDKIIKTLRAAKKTEQAMPFLPIA